MDLFTVTKKVTGYKKKLIIESGLNTLSKKVL